MATESARGEAGSNEADAAASLTDEELALVHSAFDHARAGNTNALAELLKMGLPANLTNEKGDTLLILAAYYSHPDTVKALLDAGAAVDRINDRGQSALSAATFRKHEPVARMLLEAGADPRAGAVSAVAVAEQFGLADFVTLFGGGER